MVVATDGVLIFGIIIFYEAGPVVSMTLVVVLHGYWAPQIVHSARTAARRGLDPYEGRCGRDGGGTDGDERV